MSASERHICSMYDVTVLGSVAYHSNFLPAAFSASVRFLGAQSAPHTVTRPPSEATGTNLYLRPIRSSTSTDSSVLISLALVSATGSPTALPSAVAYSTRPMPYLVSRIWPNSHRSPSPSASAGASISPGRWPTSTNAWPSATHSSTLSPTFGPALGASAPSSALLSVLALRNAITSVSDRSAQLPVTACRRQTPRKGPLHRGLHRYPQTSSSLSFDCRTRPCGRTGRGRARSASARSPRAGRAGLRWTRPS